MVSRIDLGDTRVDVVRKKVKNLHLSVNPPNGTVRITAPERMDLNAIRVFAISRLGWIRRQQRKMLDQVRESPREYLNRESHHVWGKRYLLQVVEKDAAPGVELKHRKLLLQVRPGTGEVKRRELLEDWFRVQLKRSVPPLIGKWESRMGVKVSQFFVQRMKTKWGGCNPATRTIRLNTELAKKSPEYLEYIVVHEMAHLLEPTHGDRFKALMDEFMPSWQFRRAELNRLPVAMETW